MATPRHIGFRAAQGKVASRQNASPANPMKFAKQPTGPVTTAGRKSPALQRVFAPIKKGLK